MTTSSAKHAHWERYGFGLWLLRDRATAELVGRGGLQHTDAVEGEPVEVALGRDARTLG